MCLQGPGGSSEGSAVAAPVRMSCPAETRGQTQNRGQHQASGMVYLSSQDWGPPETGTSSSVASGEGSQGSPCSFQNIRQTASLGDFSSSLSSTSRQTLTTPTPPPRSETPDKTKTAIFKSEGTVQFGEQAPGLRLRGNSLSPSKQPLFGTTEKRGELNSDQSCLLAKQIEDSSTVKPNTTL